MIYLIGGSPRSGKTILSKKLAKALDIPHLSTDYLRLIVMPYFKGEDKNENFPFEKMFDLAGIDKFFNDYSGQEMLEADIREAKTLWPGIKSFIDHLLLCKTDYIIEGVHFLPNLVSQFKDDKNFKIILLAKTDSDKIFSGLLQNKNGGDWIADNIKDDKTLLSAAKSLSEYGKYFVEESKKYGFTCINTEDNFLGRIEDVANSLKE
jgi:2-phosphoglycerate kinase